MKVFILATCRDVSLLPFTTLVFDSLRVGFPTAEIHVHGNDLGGEALQKVVEACERAGGENAFTKYFPHPATIHHFWVEQLCLTQQEPFWLCDTDMIFYGSVEDWKFETALAGWRIPEWDDEFSGCITRSRLHTSLLYIDPSRLREKMAEYEKPVAETVFTPKVNLFHPLVTPRDGRRYFNDTCSLLYQAVGGTAFTDQQLETFFHMNFGTIPDVVLPRLKNGQEMAVARAAILQEPAKGRGMWRAQMEYYGRLTPSYGKPMVFGAIDPKDAAEAVKWNYELCKGDLDAMHTNDLWYRYCHGIDDLLDTRQDGRPVMSAEQTLELFFTAALLYNSPFFVRHREMLFPVVLAVTNAYADSVRWETSPINRRRVMADVLRTCGNEMYNMIAIIKGGWGHVREIGPRIRERDWIGQHDAEDRPT